MITTLHKQLERAERYRFAIPAFNCTNLETAQAIIRAASDVQSPVIIQTSESAISYAGHKTIFALMQSVAEEEGKKIPVIIHLDHGKHFDVVKRCISLGYTSVHMDASEKRLSENIALTKKAVALGHRNRITVQGEIGYLLGYEGMLGRSFSRAAMEKIMTDPGQAKEFVEATGVDTLAVAVGTAHGLFKGREKIDFKRLGAIRKAARIPLVLHGGSGTSDTDIRRAIQTGIRIINVDTDLRLAFMDGLRKKVKRFDPSKKVDVRDALDFARLTMQKRASTIIKLFGSAGKA